MSIFIQLSGLRYPCFTILGDLGCWSCRGDGAPSANSFRLPATRKPDMETTVNLLFKGSIDKNGNSFSFFSFYLSPAPGPEDLRLNDFRFWP
jgi:hypothetical protein